MLAPVYLGGCVILVGECGLQPGAAFGGSVHHWPFLPQSPKGITE
jgi:hypothetical protein